MQCCKPNRVWALVVACWVLAQTPLASYADVTGDQHTVGQVTQQMRMQYNAQVCADGSVALQMVKLTLWYTRSSSTSNRVSREPWKAGLLAGRKCNNDYVLSRVDDGSNPNLNFTSKDVTPKTSWLVYDDANGAFPYVKDANVMAAWAEGTIVRPDGSVIGPNCTKTNFIAETYCPSQT